MPEPNSFRITIGIFALTLGFVNMVAAEQNKGCSCFRARTYPQCCTSFLLQGTFQYAISRADEVPGTSGHLVSADIGFVQNIRSTYGVGGSVYVAGFEGGYRGGIGLRHRSWLSKDVFVDLSPRITLFADENSKSEKVPGYIFSASFVYRDLLSIDVTYQIINYKARYLRSERAETGLYLGASTRSYLAPLVPLFVGLISIASIDV